METKGYTKRNRLINNKYIYTSSTQSIVGQVDKEDPKQMISKPDHKDKNINSIFQIETQWPLFTCTWNIPENWPHTRKSQ